MNLDQRCEAINALAAKHAKGENKQEQYLISIGRHVAAIKQEHPKNWQSIVEKRCSLKRSRAYELMKVGDGTTTVEKLRLAKAESVQRSRENKKEQAATDDSPLRSGQAGGNGGDPETSAERMMAAHAVLEAGDSQADDDSHWSFLPPWTDEQKAAAAELLRIISRVSQMARAFEGREDCDVDREDNAERIIASIPDRDLRNASDAIDGLERFFAELRHAVKKDPRCQPEAQDYERCEPVASRSGYAKLEQEHKARAYRLERLAQTEPAAG
jgi:hypothetical protein